MEEVYSRNKTKIRKFENAETPKKGRNTSAFLDLILCLSKEVIPYSFTLNFTNLKLQGRREEELVKEEKVI